MGRGKKRDKDKKEVDELAKATAPLSISDTPPSTSQAPVPQTAEEESEGLGLPSKSRKKKQKSVVAETQEKSQPMSVSTTPEHTATVVTSAPAPQVTQEVQEEADGLGLGLSKGKSRPRKKNKDKQAQATPSATVSAPAPSAPTPTPSVQVPGQLPQAPGQYPQVPGQHPQVPGQHPQVPGQYPQAPGQHPPAPGQYPQVPGQYPQAPGQHPQAPGQHPQAPGTRTWGTPVQPPQSIPPSSSVTQAVEQVWQQPPPQAAGRGAGRGVGLGRGAPPPGAGRGAPPSGPGRGAPPPGAGRGAPPSVPGHGAPPPEATRGTPQRELVPPSEPSSQIAPVQRETPPQTQPVRPSLRSIPLKIPGPGLRSTRRQIVLTNYLPMKIKDIKVHRYDVSFAPDKPKKLIIKAYQAVKAKLYPRHVMAFDQVKNLYCLNPLPDVKGSNRVATNIEIPDSNDKLMKFEVSFKYTGMVDLGTIIKYMKGGTSLNPPTEAIQCVDVILKQGTLESYVRAGRQYFLRPQRPKDLGDGLEMWTGLFQSAIFTSQPFINIDVAHKGFPRHQPLLQAISQDFGLDLNRPIDQQRSRGVDAFLNFIKGLRVVAKLIGGPNEPTRTREFICNGIVDPPDKRSFSFTDSETNQTVTMTVGEYFRKNKGYRITYPNMNCMWVGPRDKGIYFPMELLEVAYGQARSKQLNERQLSTMVREAATPPDIRKQKIEEVISKMNYSANPYFKHFGLEISQDFFRVESKVLEPPKLSVGQSQGVIPRNGSWQAKTLLRPETLESWGFIGVDVNPHESNSETCIRSLMDVGRQMGMRVSPPQMQQYNVRTDALQRVLLGALDKGINFVFVVISKRGRDTYQRVKKIAECNVGILTQCIKEQTAATRMNQQTARNILLKVNSKLMGINQALDQYCLPPCFKGGDVMVVGADVTHPSPDQKNIPSIAAVTASLDPQCFIYNIELSIQTPKEEMIMQFEEMMMDHFTLYRKRQNKLPRKVFVFRDGVSEGQFAQVMQYELTAIHKAYERLTGGKAPRLEVLFLLVQKRHHTRFFLTGNQAQYNVTPGTVVDTQIVHPTELDFYLVSHQAIKGTARPTRYHAVCNDGRIPDDEVEQLTFYLCHLYSRCMRSVSYPTPTYYAHLACLRARSLTYDQTFINKDLEKEPRRLRVLEKMLQHSRMFFV